MELQSQEHSLIIGRSVVLFALLISAGCAQREASPPPGMLAILAGDGNIYVVAPDGSERRAITTDGSTTGGQAGTFYGNPTWAPDGETLAYNSIRLGESGEREEGKLYVSRPGSEPEVLFTSTTHFPVYLSWSPDGGRLGYLTGADRQVQLQMITFEDERHRVTELGSAQQFFFSWAPDGDRMLWHLNGAFFMNLEARLAVKDLNAGAEADMLLEFPSYFSAPAWSPIEDTWVFAAQDGQGGDALYLAQGDRRTHIADTTFRQVTFAWNPQGRLLAYAMTPSDSSLTFGPLNIYDVSADKIIADAPSTDILGFFWSPDGQRVAYLTALAAVQSKPSAASHGLLSFTLTWHVLDVKTDKSTELASFVPTRDMLGAIRLSDQYQQSHRFWSPDSRFLVYAGIDKNEAGHIWILDAMASKPKPKEIDSGLFAVWSPR